jgi:2-amino-4-hydroxy-6-hydroxymethyldihydropteridine diphosphokinase
LEVSTSGIICFIGVGSNLADPEIQCLNAFDRVSKIKGVKLLRTSSLYRTEPVVFTLQDWFINAVVELRTVLTAHELLRRLQAIEDEMGRIREEKWAPRIIDLDILLYDQDVIQDENMKIPHPELHKRGFVLVPICEIAPYAIHPAFGVSMAGLLDRLEDKSAVNLYRRLQG